MNKHRYLTEFEIDRMAEAAFTTYMVSAEKGAAIRAAAEEGWEILGDSKPRRSAVLVAYQRAMLMYEAAKMAAKAEGARRQGAD